MKRALATVGVALGFLVTMTTPAQAHYVKTEPIVYDDGYYCLPTWVEASHGKYNRGYLKTEIKFRQIIKVPGCFTYRYFEAYGAEIQPEWWKGVSGGEPYKCRDYGAKFAQTKGETFSWSVNVPTIWCSNGYYGTFAGLWVKINGKSQGGWVFSGWHSYPSGAPLGDLVAEGLENPPAWPEWVDPVTRIVDQSKLPPSLAGEFGGASS